MPFRSSHRAVRPLGLALSLVVAAGCATAPPAGEETAAAAAVTPAATQAAAPAATETATPAAAPAGAAPAEAAPAAEAPPGEPPGEPELWMEPPEGQEWLTDDNGMQYFTIRFPKVEGTYRRIGESRIRVTNGLPFDVAEEGDDYFLVKIYRVEKRPRRNEQPAYAPPPKAQPIEELVPAESDRLSFVAFDRGLPTRGQWRNGFELVDFDGDGHLDLVHGPARKEAPVPRIFLGDGAGNWRPFPIRSLPADLRLDYGDVAVEDFDGDGRLDLALGVHIRGVVVLLHDGEGGFRSWSGGLPYTQPDRGQGSGDFSTRTLVSLDWNGDGRPDLAALGEGLRMVRPDATGFRPSSSDLVVFLNNGDGTWERRELGTGSRLRGEGMAVADLDGDRRPDLAVASMTTGGAETLFVNRGDEVDAWRLAGLPERAVTPSVTAGDFDGDGRPDLAISYMVLDDEGWRSGIDVYLARPEEWQRSALVELPGRRRFGGLATGRLPGDGHLDLVGVDWEGRAWVFLGDGAGGFALEATPELQRPDSSCDGYDVQLADLDGEPGDEIVIAYAGEEGGEMIFGEAARCRHGGSLNAWKAVPR